MARFAIDILWGRKTSDLIYITCLIMIHFKCKNIHLNHLIYLTNSISQHKILKNFYLFHLQNVTNGLVANNITLIQSKTIVSLIF